MHIYTCIVFSLLLLCSCVHQPAKAWEPSAKEVWVTKFERLPGKHISELIQAWGEPEKLGAHNYRWFKGKTYQLGGYYEPDGHTSSKIYKTTSTGVAKHVGYIDTPKERYVEPSTHEDSCNIRIITDKKGIIIHADYDGYFISRASPTYCVGRFPLP